MHTMNKTYLQSHKYPYRTSLSIIFSLPFLALSISSWTIAPVAFMHLVTALQPPQCDFVSIILIDKCLFYCVINFLNVSMSLYWPLFNLHDELYESLVLSHGNYFLSHI